MVNTDRFCVTIVSMIRHEGQSMSLLCTIEHSCIGHCPFTTYRHTVNGGGGGGSRALGDHNLLAEDWYRKTEQGSSKHPVMDLVRGAENSNIIAINMELQ